MRLFLILCAASATISLARTDPKIVKTNAAPWRKRAAKKTERPPLVARSEGGVPNHELGPVEGTVAAALAPRGGGCDSDPALLLKVAVGAAVEAAALLGVLAAGRALSALSALSKAPEIGGLHPAQWLSFLVVIFASSFVGSAVDGGLSAATNQVLDPDAVPGDPEWYANLRRPSWEPPGWVFPIMWLIVSKPTQLAAVARLFRVGGDDPGWPALSVYCAHLSLGDAWNKVFFGLQCPGRGAAVITAFFAVLLTSAWLFGSIDEVAGRLMLPTCAWVLVATALNWSIYLQN